MDTPPTTPATARSVSRVVSPASGGGLVFTTPPNSTPTTAAPQLSAQPKNPFGWQVHNPHGKGEQPIYLSAKDTAPRDPDAPAAVPWQANKATRDRGNSIGNAKCSMFNPTKPKGRPPKAPKGVSHTTSKAAPGQQQEWFLECLQGGRAYPLAAWWVAPLSGSPPALLETETLRSRAHTPLKHILRRWRLIGHFPILYNSSNTY